MSSPDDSDPSPRPPNVADFAASKPPKIPNLRSVPAGAPTPGGSTTPNPLGSINAARRPPGVADAATRSQLPDDLAAKMKAFHLQRQGASSTLRTPTLPDRSVSGSSAIGCRGSSPALSSSNSPQVPGGRPLPPTFNSAPSVPHIKKGLAAKRGLGMKLSDAAPPAAPAPSEPVPNAESSSLFDKFSEYVDTDTGTLNFRGKATIHGSGIEFSGGKKFDISLNEVDTLDELGKGNYGTVFKVRHARPRIRRPGQGLAGNRVQQPESQDPQTGKVMAMKEIRLELDEAKFAAIIMELDILHRCRSPYIIDFYGAFFQEGAVYICMQFMDGGSIDKLYGDGVPEGVLRKITLATVMGLKCLKDDHNIIHRDVKPTNILVNSAGCVKICDFGVSGNLVASIAKTNIGCQSYMAPERISGGGMAQASAVAGGGTYSVQSDIWSLGLTVIECALGQYPYPPETYDNIFSQLSAIVDGEPPDLPQDRYSDMARDFIKGTLHKVPKLRPTYAMLLAHPWLANIPDSAPARDDPEVADWVRLAVERKRSQPVQKPALHAAPLDAISPS